MKGFEKGRVGSVRVRIREARPTQTESEAGSA